MYESLCAIVPGLQNRLLESESEDNILHIADLVRDIFLKFNFSTHSRVCLRFRKEPLALELMTQKA